MTFLPIIILALIQGITEFLPVSSSGHLVLVHNFMNEGQNSLEQDLLMDVAVHVGTLFSVLVYFRRDIWQMILGLKDLADRKVNTDSSRLNIQVLIGSIPVIIAGFLIHKFSPESLRSTEVMAWMTVIFGIILWWADRNKNTARSLSDMDWKDALIIGCAQAIALVPGTSRSGITMSAARFLGFSRTESAHFSLLLAIIAITGAGTLAGIDLIESGNSMLSTEAFIAAGLAFISALLAIDVMMRWLAKCSFTVFAVYRVILGGALLVMLYAGLL